LNPVTLVRTVPHSVTRVGATRQDGALEALPREGASSSETKGKPVAVFHEFNVRAIDGRDDLLAALRGQVVLAVNVASRCGYTPQYTGLEALHRELSADGFSVVGFPCNQFGAQEPGTEAQIREFCSLTYEVTFPLAAKIEVNGARRHPLYAWLTAPENGHAGDIEWNFEKFLIGRDGRVRGRYPAATKPQDAGLMQDIAEALA
jgi:glutathione peroxidase